MGKREVPQIVPASRSRVVEPLSAARYKIQLTADTALKDKLELARDLMRHTVPDGDFAPILSRALDLLIEKLMKRRFGARGKQPAVPRPNHGLSSAQSDEASIAAQPPAPHSASSGPSAPSAAPHPESQPHSAEATSPNAPPQAPHAAPVPPLVDATPEVSRRSKPRAISRATRRTVAERDGLRCTWQSPDGVRCESRAWLENDHADPRGRGEGSEPDNIRLLCRAHNQRATELHYGRSHMVDAIARARKGRSPVPPVP